jgi:phospholipid/cholesterol/gamma-HCH transport system substrate-binding protein
MTDYDDPRFRHLKSKIGAFIAVAALVIMALPFIIGRSSDLFVATYNLRFTVDKGTGFTRGMAVKLSGFRIGKVASIVLNDAATVDVLLKIDRKYQKWIRSDSRAKLVKEGLVGDMVVEVSVGSETNPVLGNNDVLAYTKTRTLDELAIDITEAVKPVLKDLREIIGYVNDPEGDIRQSLKHIALLSRNLETTRLHADRLLITATRQTEDLSGGMKLLVGESASSLRRVNSSLAQVEQRLPSILEHTEQTLQHTEALAAALRQTADQVLPQAPAMMDESRQTLKDANELLEATRQVWPISIFINRPEQRLLVPGDSHE